jgi:hypothetical protein
VWALAVAGGVVVLGLAWIVVTGLMARSQLEAARADVSAAKAALVAGHDQEAAQIAARLKRQADSAHARTSGPAWWLASQVPWAGAPLASVRELTGAVDALAHNALTPAVKAGMTMAPSKVLVGHGRLDLSLIAQSTQPLGQAASAVSAVAHSLAGGHQNTWLGAVDSKRALLVSQVNDLSRTLDNATRASRLLPSMLGSDGVRRYFVAFETPAEARGLGGLPGSYGILTADHGRVHFTKFGPDTDITDAASVSFGNDWRARYAQTFHASSIFVNSTASPHFPYAANIWLSMWEKQFGQRLDGAIALDPTALAYLLKATGPVTLSDGQQLTGENATQFLESGIYAKFPRLDAADIDRRKAYLVQAARDIAEHITDGASGDPSGVLSALTDAVRERRLVAYSAHATEEQQLEASPIAGEVSETTQPYVGLVINNAASGKLDYYLNRSLTYERTTCDATTATVTVKLTNTAPSHGLPQYVTLTQGLGHAPLGTNVDDVALYLTHGADLNGVTLDGKRQYMQSGNERGHPVVSFTVLLRPGQTRTLVYKVAEPRALGSVMVPIQPLVRPMNVALRSPSC